MKVPNYMLISKKERKKEKKKEKIYILSHAPTSLRLSSMSVWKVASAAGVERRLARAAVTLTFSQIWDTTFREPPGVDPRNNPGTYMKMKSNQIKFGGNLSQGNWTVKF